MDRWPIIFLVLAACACEPPPSVTVSAVSTSPENQNIARPGSGTHSPESTFVVSIEKVRVSPSLGLSGTLLSGRVQGESDSATFNPENSATATIPENGFVETRLERTRFQLADIHLGESGTQELIRVHLSLYWKESASSDSWQSLLDVQSLEIELDQIRLAKLGRYTEVIEFENGTIIWLGISKITCSTVTTIPEAAPYLLPEPPVSVQDESNPDPNGKSDGQSSPPPHATLPAPDTHLPEDPLP